MAGCLTDEMVVEYIEQQLAPESVMELRHHIVGCPACLHLVHEAAGSYLAERPSHAPLAEAATSPPAQDMQAVPLSGSWAPPDVLDEFRLVRPLGSGAMGQVYLGQDTLLHRQVAVKFIGTARPDASSHERFLTEARAIARLAHPNVVTIYRVGEAEEGPYLVSEFVSGKSLDLLAKPLPWEQALSLGVQLSRGLAAAHQQGVLHRDIKPANAILADDGRVKLLDFGLAKLLDVLPGSHHQPTPTGDVEPSHGPPSPGLTDTGMLVGTPLYMAPEAWRGEAATTRTDVYSLGALLYELCAGHPPHKRSTYQDLRDAVQKSDAAPLAKVVPGTGHDFAAVVDRCLRRDARERFASGEELRQALERIANRGRQRTLGRNLGIALMVTIAAGALGWMTLKRTRAASGMVLIPGGRLRMGSSPEEIRQAYSTCQSQPGDECVLKVFEREQPARQVQVSAFRIDVTEVTNEQFAAWLNRLSGLRIIRERWVYEGPIWLADLYPQYRPAYGLSYRSGHYQPLVGSAQKPVTQITWDAALRYCQSQGKRLPTEAEWEFAARGTRDSQFPWGNEQPRCEGVVFGRGSGQSCAFLGPGPTAVGVSEQDRTPEGVLDLAGNVSEWVMDRFEDRYRPCGPVCVDPRVEDVPPGSGPIERMIRGGDWNQVAVAGRSAGRGRWRQDQVLKNVGFRCAAAAP